VAARRIPAGRGTASLSGMNEYLAQAQLMAESVFRLPPGYRVLVGREELVLRRADGSAVAAFGGLDAVPKEVEGAAHDDVKYGLEIAG
jgi:hypothetical protein